MSRDATREGIASVLGEHLIVVLIVVTVVLATLGAYQALSGRMNDVVARAKVRVDTPFSEAYLLETIDAAPPSLDPAELMPAAGCVGKFLKKPSARLVSGTQSHPSGCR